MNRYSITFEDSQFLSRVSFIAIAEDVAEAIAKFKEQYPNGNVIGVILEQENVQIPIPRMEYFSREALDNLAQNIRFVRRTPGGY